MYVHSIRVLTLSSASTQGFCIQNEWICISCVLHHRSRDCLHAKLTHPSADKQDTISNTYTHILHAPQLQRHAAPLLNYTDEKKFQDYSGSTCFEVDQSQLFSLGGGFQHTHCANCAVFEIRLSLSQLLMMHGFIFFAISDSHWCKEATLIFVSGLTITSARCEHVVCRSLSLSILWLKLTHGWISLSLIIIILSGCARQPFLVQIECVPAPYKRWHRQKRSKKYFRE